MSRDLEDLYEDSSEDERFVNVRLFQEPHMVEEVAPRNRDAVEPMKETQVERTAVSNSRRTSRYTSFETTSATSLNSRMRVSKSRPFPVVRDIGPEPSSRQRAPSDTRPPLSSPSTLRRTESLALMYPGPGFRYPETSSPKKFLPPPSAGSSPPPSPTREAASRKLRAEVSPIPAPGSSKANAASLPRQRTWPMTTTPSDKARFALPVPQVPGPSVSSHAVVTSSTSPLTSRTPAAKRAGLFTTPTTLRVQRPATTPSLTKQKTWNGFSPGTSFRYSPITSEKRRNSSTTNEAAKAKILPTSELTSRKRNTDSEQGDDKASPRKASLSEVADEDEGDPMNTMADGYYQAPPGQILDDIVNAPILFGPTNGSPEHKEWSACNLEDDTFTLSSIVLAEYVDATHARVLSAMPSAVQWAVARHPEELKKLSLQQIQNLHVPNNVSGVRTMLKALKCESDIINFETAVLEELDVEEAALRRNPAAGLGCWTPIGRAPILTKNEAPELYGWYGGKIDFKVSMRYDEKTGNVFPVLLPLKFGPSNRLKRFGSYNSIAITISRTALNKKTDEDGWTEFFCKPFDLFGHTFATFYSKEASKRYLYRSSTPVLEGVQSWPNSMTTAELFELFNPMAYNASQTITKYTARFALALSDTVPVVRLKAKNIRLIKDIVSTDVSPFVPPETHQVMTDGCGYGNSALFYEISRVMGVNFGQCDAIQVRIGGIKGLLLRCGHDTNREPVIYVRDSQVKAKFETLLCDDKTSIKNCLNVVELVRPAYARTCVRISSQAIHILSANGVPTKVFLSLLESMVNEMMKLLITGWEDVHGRGMVIQVLDQRCGVTAAQRSKYLGAMRRAYGRGDLISIDDSEAQQVPGADDSDEVDDADDMDEKIAPAPDWMKERAREYVSSAAKAMMMLRSGFDPRSNMVLRKELGRVIEEEAKRISEKGQLYIERSADAMLVPDPYGVLEEGEIYFATSLPFVDTYDRTTSQLTGPCLIFRNPLYFLTDVQKVQAVVKPELNGYRDVIVVSSKGSRSLPSKLGGGDVDGDRGVLIFDNRVVLPFVNADEKDIDLPKTFVAKHFEKSTKQLSTFLTDPNVTMLDLLKIMHKGGSELVGLLSNLHETASYEHGHDHADALLLGRLFSVELDGAKSGLRTKQKVFNNLNKLYSSRTPEYKAIIKNKKDVTRAVREERLGPHVLDELIEHGRSVIRRQIDAYQISADKMLLYDPATHTVAYKVVDAITTRPWLEKVRDAIQALCSDLRRAWLLIKSASRDASVQSKNGSIGSTVYDKRRQSVAQQREALHLRFASGPLIDSRIYGRQQLVQLAASYSLWMDQHVNPSTGYAEDPHGEFAFAIAWEELCKIRAEACGPTETIPRYYAHNMKMAYKLGS
ncbi:RNA dependent RNA polymerase-domain-containing protein [Auriculariales sp. MPI-PUGE-AT-0066]|nr:RNA dependent RNA polymerase-domain-containing protein [Auriculariales sp. MPI-PUGE-AT-0066]